MKTRQEVQAIADALEGMPVWGVLMGSAAAEAGLRYGDVILEVNGQRTRTLAEFLAARDLEGPTATVSFFRDGATRRIEMSFHVRRSRTLEDLVNEFREQRLLPLPLLKRSLEVN